MQKIGVFDSGIGGLTTLEAIRKVLPDYDYVYLSDRKNLPYGDKTRVQLEKLGYVALDKLFALDCGVVVVACNTVCSNVNLEKYSDKVFCITPVTAEYTKTHNTFTLATSMAANSGIFFGKVVACPLLVPLIEAEKPDQEAIKSALKTYLCELNCEQEIVLGCTHYNHVRDIISSIVSNKITSDIDLVPGKFVEFMKDKTGFSKSGSLVQMDMSDDII